MTDSADLTEDAVLDGRLRLRQPRAGHHRFGAESIWAAAAVPARPGQTVLDLGAGTGVIGLAVAARVPGARALLVEREATLAALAAANAGANGLACRAQAIVADVAHLPLAAAAVDHVVVNPPFFDAGAHRGAATPGRDRARHMAPDALPVWVQAAKAAVRAKGTLTIVHRARAVPAILAALGPGWGGTLVWPLWPKPGLAARSVLVQSVKGSRAPFVLGHGTVLHRPDGGPTTEAAAVLRAAAALELTAHRAAARG